MDNIILDLGIDVNILPKITWEIMGKPKLTWSPIQLVLANQHRIFPIGWLSGVPIDIDGVSNTTDFKVIKSWMVLIHIWLFYGSIGHLITK